MLSNLWKKKLQIRCYRFIPPGTAIQLKKKPIVNSLSKYSFILKLCLYQTCD